MTPRCSNRKCLAMTLVEAVVVIFVIAFVALMILPAVSRPSSRAQRINCTNNLKQLGLAYHIWEGDNNDKYPMDLAVTNGGAKELMNGPEAWRAYQVMSNEISSAKILFCPQDAVHARWATNFGDDLKDKISYFIGMDAREGLPQSLLSGDDNFMVNGSAVNSGMVVLTSNTPAVWDSSRHVSEEKILWWFTRKGPTYGNIGLGDGSVQSATSSYITNLLSQTGLATNRLAIP